MSMEVNVVMRRFLKLLKDAEDLRKVQSTLAQCTKEHFVSWTDEVGLDALHYAILMDNYDTVDYLLKMGYFVPPWEPKVNMYAHLAARLGNGTVMGLVLHHRPEDFKETNMPLFIPKEFKKPAQPATSSKKSSTTQPFMPAVTGNAMATPLTTSKLRHTNSTDPGGSPPAKTSGSSKAQTQATTRRKSSVAQGDSTPTMNSDEFPDFALQSRPGHRGSIGLGRSGRGAGVSRPAGQSMSMRRQSMGTTMKNYGKGGLIHGHQGLDKRRNSSPQDLPPPFRPRKSSMTESVTLRSTPLDVAAHYRQVNCVKELLKMYILPAHPEMGQMGFVTLAALANHSASLRLMIKESQANKEDIRSAIKVSVSEAFSPCLEVLFSESRVDLKDVFGGVNYFHVLYSQNFRTLKRTLSVSRLPAMTCLLIQKEHDVAAKFPSRMCYYFFPKRAAVLRTYPLYTLVDNAFSSKDFTFSEDFIICMKMLIMKGADPNFDEMEHERKLKAGPRQGTYEGRRTFCSVLHCIMECLELYCSHFPSRQRAVRFAEECLETLTQHGANVSQIGTICCVRGDVLRGDVFFQLTKCCAELGLQRGLLRFLMRFGGQPQRKIEGFYALNIYLENVFELIKTTNAEEIALRLGPDGDVAKMIEINCAIMAPWHIKDIRNIFNYQRKLTDELVELVNGELEQEAMKVHTLRITTAWQVWKLCKRSDKNIKKLPVAKEIKNTVLPFILFGTFW